MTSQVLTFDTGMLIALEKHRQRANEVFRRATERKMRMFVPSVVVAEWWRGRTDRRDDILAAVVVEPPTERIAKIAGEALAAITSATAVDAIVMASAAVSGGLVYTSDVDDLERLQGFFPTVRIFAI